jgi:hypothetical protein
MKLRDYIFVALIVGLTFWGVSGRWAQPTAQARVDTLVVRDTVRDTVPVAVEKFLVRTDTVWLRAVADTVFVEVEVPVEQKIYQTADYRAVVEGFRPRLAEIEIFRNTTYIKETTSPRSRWGLGLQAGYGIAGDTKLRPYIGLGVQYNLITF